MNIAGLSIKFQCFINKANDYMRKNVIGLALKIVPSTSCAQFQIYN